MSLFCRMLIVNDMLTVTNASPDQIQVRYFNSFQLFTTMFFCTSFCLCTLLMILKNIRIYHECEGRKEKSVLRITIWHREACRVMTNGDLEGSIFLSYPHTNNGFFFFLTTVFICLIVYLFINFKISFQKSRNTLRCNFT